MRVRSKPWHAGQMENEKIVKEPQALRGRWREFFGNENPIHIEIGCGKGRFVCESAAANPDINFIAMERVPKIIAYAARLSDITDAKVAFIMEDGCELCEYFEDGELSRIYLNFSDPWEGRKKWQKRRLTHSSFLEIYKKLLVPGGAVYQKTDNRELFDFSVESFTENGWELKNVTYDLHKSGFEGNIMTEYEQRFLNLNMPIYRLEAYVKP